MNRGRAVLGLMVDTLHAVCEVLHEAQADVMTEPVNGGKVAANLRRALSESSFVLGSN